MKKISLAILGASAASLIVVGSVSAEADACSSWPSWIDTVRWMDKECESAPAFPVAPASEKIVTPQPVRVYTGRPSRRSVIQQVQERVYPKERRPVSQGVSPFVLVAPRTVPATETAASEMKAHFMQENIDADAAFWPSWIGLPTWAR